VCFFKYLCIFYFLIFYWCYSYVLIVNAGSWLYVFSFTNTKRTNGQTGAGVTNIQFLMPGYPSTTTQYFTNDFLNVVKDLTPVSFRTFDTGSGNYNIWYVPKKERKKERSKKYVNKIFY
jgi:hypothetical protein